MRHGIVIGVAVLVLGATGAARADAVSPPTVTCPRGATAQAAHVPGGLCALDTCTSDANCAGGARCADAPLCIVTMSCGGRLDAGPPPDGGFGPPCTFETAPSDCDSCSTGTCETRRVCLPALPRPPSGGGCACSVGDRGYAMGAWLVAVGVAIALVRRSRR